MPRASFYGLSALRQDAQHNINVQFDSDEKHVSNGLVITLYNSVCCLMTDAFTWNDLPDTWLLQWLRGRAINIHVGTLRTSCRALGNVQPKKQYAILCYAFLGMACIFIPFEGETVIKTCSDAITPAGPPICSSSYYSITIPIH